MGPPPPLPRGWEGGGLPRCLCSGGGVVLARWDGAQTPLGLRDSIECFKGNIYYVCTTEHTYSIVVHCMHVLNVRLFYKKNRNNVVLGSSSLLSSS